MARTVTQHSSDPASRRSQTALPLSQSQPQFSASGRNSWQKILRYLRPHWRPTLLGILALFAVNALGVYIPLLIRKSIDGLQSGFTLQQLLWDSGVLLVLASVMWVIRVQSRIFLFGVGRQVEFDLKQQIFQHLLKLEPDYFATHTIGDLISRSTSDVDNIRRLLGFAVLSSINTLFAYALTLPVMLAINVRLTLIALMIYPFMLILVLLFSQTMRTQQMAVQQELADLSELIQEDMSGISLIKIYAQEENERQAFHGASQKLLNANLDLAQTRSFLFPLIGGLAYVSVLLMLWQGGSAIATGSLSVGDFIALILYIERLVFPTALLGFTITTYQRGEVSIDRVESILAVIPNIQDADVAMLAERSSTIAMPREQVQGHLKADGLTYTYPGATQPALNNLSFAINPGQTVAIVGSIGSGKTTLANALPRLLDVAPGQLFLDGQDITQIRLADLRAAIAYVPQESFLFSTEINNNIRYGDPVASQKAVENSAQQAQIHAEILNFPKQYETLVGERGITLSGGQRQRTALARGLLVDAPILVLDDSLSSVDNETALHILENLSTGTQRKTVLFITHQLTAAAQADLILVMSEGQIVQTGTHRELLNQPGLYQSLWQDYQLEVVLS